ncbi:lasso RiPP family leader peptide-containing protein [Streptomyces melanosporofaciens]|uniref:Uncharacterized protein n=1 Tax=Streptomyces melanosporofaciens TaxID=67327 RepID=A0A1H4ICF1_STRMJ|nr:lasso RiPP family leader peptide-containing protein [Streptomyces melanosporofaciens]SEB31747.1 hypothetical protein SAMN04490356_0502 [Streptomyces melanosporofaciens]
MNHKTPPPSVYQAPLVQDAGNVTAVTLGPNTFDSSDESEYKDS